MNDFWNNKKILVTGSSGFVGRHLVDNLINKRGILRKNLYQKYLDYVIYEKEKTLYEKEKTLQEILNSESYKIARYFISKIRFIKYLLQIKS